MQVKILGTAAAEGWPAIFCACPTCLKAREVRGKNIRSRASARFSPRHQIDLPPGVWYHEAVLNADLSRLEHVFDYLFAMKQRLEKAGSFMEGIFVATHFSHNVGILHEDIERILGEHGILTAYDGMEIAL
jgi:hypothetical protein